MTNEDIKILGTIYKYNAFRGIFAFLFVHLSVRVNKRALFTLSIIGYFQYPSGHFLGRKILSWKSWGVCVLWRNFLFHNNEECFLSFESAQKASETVIFACNLLLIPCLIISYLHLYNHWFILIDAGSWLCRCHVEKISSQWVHR